MEVVMINDELWQIFRPCRSRNFKPNIHDRGYSQRTIARVLGISRSTVRSYQEESDVPDWCPRKRTPSQLDVYEKYLRRRWAEGCRDITTLWKELQQNGYSGKRKGVARYLRRFQEKNTM